MRKSDRWTDVGTSLIQDIKGLLNKKGYRCSINEYYGVPTLEVYRPIIFHKFWTRVFGRRVGMIAHVYYYNPELTKGQGKIVISFKKDRNQKPSEDIAYFLKDAGLGALQIYISRVLDDTIIRKEVK